MKDDKNKNSYALPLGLAIGLSLGTAIGAATHNIGLWMPIGVSLGLCFSMMFNQNEDDDEE